MNQKKIFQAYSDESGINDEDRYTSVSIVSGEKAILNCLRDRLNEEINDKRVKEVKFVEITGYKRQVTKTARTFIKIAINDFASSKGIRIDTMTMDKQYLLAVFPNYDTEQKLEHMYYCLLSHIGRQWNNEQWNLYPDVNSKINWNKITTFLNRTRLRKDKDEKPLLIELILQDNPLFRFGEVKQLCSLQEPLIQLTDLFAGLARFSHEQNVDCSRWAVSQDNGWQRRMKLRVDGKIIVVSQTNGCRYKIIGELYNLCHKHRLGVSIKTKKHLNTWRPKNPINFWDYKSK